MTTSRRRLGRSGALLVALALVAFAAGCAARRPAAAPPALNSDLIEARFGSYGVEVLASDARTRVSNLYSLEDGRRVCRTFALVRFEEPVDPRLAGVHRDVLAGGSLGATLRRAGWAVEKEHLFLGDLPAGDPLAAVYTSMEIEPTPLAVDVYRLVASRPGLAIDYATIAEVHHPDHLGIARLRSLYDPLGQLPEEPSPEVEAILGAVVEALVSRLSPAAQDDHRLAYR